MRVLIDSASGCCNGVGRAISAAERYLQEHDTLYSLGAIVHNDAEIRRLAGLGLKTIGYQDLDSLKGSTVLIRAHGEPPSTYRLAEQSGVSLIDCTCPVVLALQRKIAAKYSELSVLGGQVIIFGKRGHAEVNGLVGQTDGQAVVVESIADLEDTRQTDRPSWWRVSRTWRTSCRRELLTRPILWLFSPRPQRTLMSSPP